LWDNAVKMAAVAVDEARIKKDVESMTQLAGKVEEMLGDPAPLLEDASEILAQVSKLEPWQKVHGQVESIDETSEQARLRDGMASAAKSVLCAGDKTWGLVHVSAMEKAIAGLWPEEAEEEEAEREEAKPENAQEVAQLQTLKERMKVVLSVIHLQVHVGSTQQALLRYMADMLGVFVEHCSVMDSEIEEGSWASQLRVLQAMKPFTIDDKELSAADVGDEWAMFGRNSRDAKVRFQKALRAYALDRLMEASVECQSEEKELSQSAIDKCGLKDVDPDNYKEDEALCKAVAKIPVGDSVDVDGDGTAAFDHVVDRMESAWPLATMSEEWGEKWASMLDPPPISGHLDCIAVHLQEAFDRLEVDVKECDSLQAKYACVEREVTLWKFSEETLQVMAKTAERDEEFKDFSDLRDSLEKAMGRVKIVAAFSPDASEQFYDTIMKARALLPRLKDLVPAMAWRLTTCCLVELLLNPAATEDLAGSLRKTLKFGESLGIKQENLDPTFQRQVDAAQKAAESNAPKSKEGTDKKEKKDKKDKKVEKKEKKAEKKEKKEDKEDKKEKYR